MKRKVEVVAERPWIITALVLAAMVHIVSVLAMPRVAPNDAFIRLGSLGAIEMFHPLPPARPGAELVPFGDPAAVRAACLYDLSDGPLHVRGKLSGDNFVSLSFNSRHGRVFYALTDKGTTGREFDIYVVTEDQLEAMQAKDSADEPPKELRVVSPGRRGFVIATVLAPQASAYDEAVTQISALGCASEPRAVR